MTLNADTPSGKKTMRSSASLWWSTICALLRDRSARIALALACLAAVLITWNQWKNLKADSQLRAGGTSDSFQDGMTAAFDPYVQALWRLSAFTTQGDRSDPAWEVVARELAASFSTDSPVNFGTIAITKPTAAGETRVSEPVLSAPRLERALNPQLLRVAPGEDLGAFESFRIQLEHSRDANSSVLADASEITRTDGATMLVAPVYLDAVPDNASMDLRRSLHTGFAFIELPLREVLSRGRYTAIEDGTFDLSLKTEIGARQFELYLSSDGGYSGSGYPIIQRTVDYLSQSWVITVSAKTPFQVTWLELLKICLIAAALFTVIVALFGIVAGKSAQLDQVRHVTQRLEATLKQREGYLQLLAEGLPLGLALLNSDGDFCFVNRNLQTLLGRSREELLGAYWISFLAPADVVEVSDGWRAAADDPAQTALTFRFVPATGEPVWVAARVSVVLNEERQEAYLLSITDVSAMKELAKKVPSRRGGRSRQRPASPPPV